MKKSSVSVILIVSVLLSFVCGNLGAYFLLGNGGATNTIIGAITTTIPYVEDMSLSDVVKKNADAVVVVEGFSKGNLASTGSGFIYKKVDGGYYVMTNHHVIGDMDEVKVVLNHDIELKATVKGSEIYSDVAVLFIEYSSEITPVTLGKSNEISVGDTVFTMGSPEGVDYAGTVTRGIVSGIDRLVQVSLNGQGVGDYYMKVIQTDASINPGNSGGALFNTNGEVIGMTNLKLVADTVEGMGFAIPIEDAIFYATKLESDEGVVRPFLGIGMLDLTNSFYLWQNRISVPSHIKNGVAVSEVVADSPASKAGIQKGDIIVMLGEKDIKSVAELRYELYKHSVGDSINVVYYRNGKKKSANILLEKKKD